MAASPFRLTLAALLLSLTVWVWGLGGLLFHLRWHSIERPLPPPRQLFPYGEMRIGVDASYPPFAVATADDLFGLDIDLGLALAEQIGITPRFVNMGYDGLYDAIRADQVDMVISTLLIDPARTRDVYYTRPYYNAGLVLVSDPAGPLSGMASLPGRSLAYEFGSAADAEVRLWSRRIDPFTTRPYELPAYALDALRLGQSDAALVDATSLRLYLHEHPGWNPQHVYVTDALYAIAIRIDRYHTWEAVDRALRELERNGSLQAIIAAWL